MWDGFSLNTNDDRYNDASNTYPTRSSTTYNPTYLANEPAEEPVFDIFDDLEKHRPLARGAMPQGHMAGMTGTFSSFPRDQMDDPSGATSTFSGDLDETELVTDMLDDMTKNDYLQNDFVEAHNPNLKIPRAALKSDIKVSGWLSVC
jgi:hypothetical protein